MRLLKALLKVILFMLPLWVLLVLFINPIYIMYAVCALLVIQGITGVIVIIMEAYLQS